MFTDILSGPWDLLILSYLLLREISLELISNEPILILVRKFDAGKALPFISAVHCEIKNLLKIDYKII